MIIFFDTSGSSARKEQEIKENKKEPLSLSLVALQDHFFNDDKWLKIMEQIILSFKQNFLRKNLIKFERMIKMFHFSDFINKLHKEIDKKTELAIYKFFLNEIIKILDQNTGKIWIKSCLVPPKYKKNTKPAIKNNVAELIYIINSIKYKDFPKNKFKIICDNKEFSDFWESIHKEEYEKEIGRLNIIKNIEYENIEMVTSAVKHPFFFIPDWIAGITRQAYIEENSSKKTKKLIEYIDLNVNNKMTIIDYGK